MSTLNPASESLKTLFVDRDGTLVGTCNANFGAYSAALRHFRMKSPSDLKERFHQGKSWEQISKEVLPSLDKKVLEEIHNYKQAIFPSFFSQLNWNEEILKLLSRHNWALVSNGSRTSSLEILSQKSNLTPFAVVGPSATLRPKPSPDMFSYLLTKERLNHNTILVLEDSITGGEAAKLAGLSYKIVSHLC